MDVNFSSIEELLSSKLESLQALLLHLETEATENRDSMVANNQDIRQKHAADMNKARIQSNTTTINEIVESLTHSRSEVSSVSREMLLAQLYKLIVTKPILLHNEESAGTKDYVSEETAQKVTNMLLGGEYRSPTEFILLFRVTVAFLASALEDFGEAVDSEFLARILTLIQDTPTSNVTSENKASVISGFCGLLLVLHADTSAFGVDETIKWLLEVSQTSIYSAINLQASLQSGDREYSTLMDDREDKRLVSEQELTVVSEANIGIAALHGVGALVTLLSRGQYLNELLQTISSEAVEIIDNEANFEISKASARLLALCYEMYDYEAEEDQDSNDTDFNYNAPYYEQESLLTICLRLANVSSKKVGKNEKKEQNSIFRELANTIQIYTDPEKREEVYKKSPTGLELAASSVSSTSVKLSRSRSISINSWFLYFRLLHLKWCFGFGLHDQLLSNPEIREILREPSTFYLQKFDGDREARASSSGFGRDALTDHERFTSREKKRASDLKKARVNKLTGEMEELNILS